MKYFLTIMAFSLVLLAGEKFSIQVISVKKDASITDEFMQKVITTGLPYSKEEVQGEERIYLGDFKSKEEASKALVNIRKNVSSDAFICEGGKAITNDANLKMQQAMLMAKARTLKKMKEGEVKPTEQELETIEPIKVDTTKKKLVIKRKDTKKIVPMKEEAKTEEIFCKDTKQALRESEIASAISFYETSSYYTFSQAKN